MKILVTGATGFLGRRLCELLDTTHYEVIATGRNTRVGAELRDKGVRFIAGDLCDPVFTQEIVRGCKAIVHCAALSTIWAKYNDFYQANVVAVHHLITAAQQNNIPHFIHVSTPSLYVGAQLKEGITEHSPLPKKFSNDYVKTKKISEDLLLEAAQQGAFNTTIIRPQGIFGPNDTSIIPRLITASDQGGIPLIKGGQHPIDATYIDNVCHALSLCLTSKPNTSNIYNITNGEPVRFVELLQKIFRSIDHPLQWKVRPYWLLKLVAHLSEKTYKSLRIRSEPPLTHYTLSVLSEQRTLNISAAQQQLGYKPIVTLDEGIERYAQWYKRAHQ